MHNNIMINWMKKEDITWLPGFRPNENGWIVVDGTEKYVITDWHHFDDFGQTIETVQAKNLATGDSIEVYSMDEGHSWHSELD